MFKTKKYLYRIGNRLIRFLGLRGSWKWACRNMQEGRVVFRITDTGALKYKLDCEAQNRILWAGTHDPFGLAESDWDSANVFLSDFECIDWVVFDIAKYHKEYKKRWDGYGLNLNKYRVDGYLSRRF